MRRPHYTAAVVAMTLLASCRHRVAANPVYVPPLTWLDRKLGVAGEIAWAGRDEPQAGDEVWSFRSPAESWRQLCGTAGVCLVRHGKVVDGYVTVVN